MVIFAAGKTAKAHNPLLFGHQINLNIWQQYDKIKVWSGIRGK
jgi:hypothetical protein